MTTDNKKARATSEFPAAKIRRVVRDILPKGKAFRLLVVDSGIRKMKVVRVVTPAWKTLPRSERIGKLLDALNETLTKQEQKGILRVSVLTPKEYEEYKDVAPRGANA